MSERDLGRLLRELLDDDEHTYDYVIEMLQRLFNPLAIRELDALFAFSAPRIGMRIRGITRCPEESHSLAVQETIEYVLTHIGGWLCAMGAALNGRHADPPRDETRRPSNASGCGTGGAGVPQRF